MTIDTFAPWPAPDPMPMSEGPDYVALVIEWADDDDVAVTRELARVPAPPATRSVARILAAIGGAIGALVLARWGVRRLRHA